MYDLIIIGGGPGGVAAGVYAARKKIHTLLLTETFGGQSEVSAHIENWIGSKTISGFDLAKNLEEHVRAQESIEIKTGERVTQVIQNTDKTYTVTTEGGDSYKTRTIITAAGSRRRKLDVPGEAEYNAKGVAYCSTCDAPFFAGKDVVIVGGGNAGLEAVLDLKTYAKSMYLLIRGDSLKGDPITQEKVKQSGVQIIYHAEITQILPDKEKKFVGGVEYKDNTNETKHRLDVQGVFVEIGAVPNSEMLGDLVAKNKFGEVTIDHRTAATSREGIWAAGDVTDAAYKQNNISAGDAVKAALSAYMYLQHADKGQTA